MKLSATLLFLNIFALSYAQAPKNYTIEEFLNASESELKAHKLHLDLLAQQNKLHLPQSQAMLFYPDPLYNKRRLKESLIAWRKEVPKRLLQDQNQGINKALSEAIKKENKENSQGNIALYHSTQPDLYAKSYINTELRKLDLELKGKKVDTETLLMRDLNKPRSYEEEKTKRKELFTISDSPEFRDTLKGEYLISVNPAITSSVGTHGFLGESALYYFLQKFNISPKQTFPLFIPKDNKLLDETIQRKINDLSFAYREFNNNTDTGILLQFIVKDDNLGHKILYNAEPAGIKRYVTLQEKQTSDPLTVIETIRTTPTAFKEPHKDALYREAMHTLDTQQMRLIITGDKLLDLENPAVKEFDVKAYSGSDKSLKEFQQKVDTAIQEIRSNYLAQKQQMSWPKRIQYGARDLFYRRQSPWEQRQQYKRMLRGDIGSPFE